MELAAIVGEGGSRELAQVSIRGNNNRVCVCHTALVFRMTTTAAAAEAKRQNRSPGCFHFHTEALLIRVCSTSYVTTHEEERERRATMAK